MATSTYAPDFKVGPVTEVDYGVSWTNGGDPGWRVSYIAAERKVVAAKGNREWMVLASDIDFAVVETLLSRSYWTTGIRHYDDCGWSTACTNRADVSWVIRRLRHFKWGSRIVTTSPSADADPFTIIDLGQSSDGTHRWAVAL